MLSLLNLFIDCYARMNRSFKAMNKKYYVFFENDLDSRFCFANDRLFRKC